jgi:hypothetical protein
MLSLPQASHKNRQSVMNWLSGTKPLVRSGSVCFTNGLEDDDYVALGINEVENAGLETLVEAFLRKFPRLAGHVRLSGHLEIKLDSLTTVFNYLQVK